MGEFAKAVFNFKLKAGESAERVVRAMMLELISAIDQETPVDTGRLRANTQLTIGSPASSSTLDTDPDTQYRTEKRQYVRYGSKSYANAMNTLADFKMGDKLYVTNNVRYAYFVEMGINQPTVWAMFRKGVQTIIANWGGIVSQASGGGSSPAGFLGR